LPKPKLTRDERDAQRRRKSALLGTVGQQNAYWLGQAELPGGISKDDAAQYEANSRRAKLEQDAIDAAEAQKQKPQYFRVNDNTKISVDDPLFAEKRRWESVRKKGNEQLNRTNIASRKDINFEEYEQNFYRRPPPDGDVDALPPEAGQSGAPAVSTGFAIQPSGGTMALHPPTPSLASSRKRSSDGSWRSSPRSKRRSRVEAGELLTEVKTKLLDHGQFTPWLERMGIHKRTAQRCLMKVKNDTL
jgi:hypothetical protein